MGFSLTVFTSPYLEHLVERVALNAKMGSVMGMEQITTMVAASMRNLPLLGVCLNTRMLLILCFACFRGQTKCLGQKVSL